MKKFNLKSTKFINFIFLLILVLLFIFIYYFSPTITNIIENSKNNNVNKNIQLLKESNLPDKENGNVIIAGHSGNSYKAYFKNLVKLNNGDEAKIVYNGKTYIYSLSNSYEVEKTGRVEISRNINKQTLTLITCKHNTNKQIVFVFELKNII